MFKATFMYWGTALAVVLAFYIIPRLIALLPKKKLFK